MIGLDTNILVRFFVKDDPEQAHEATSLIYTLTPEEPGWVGVAVLVELIWAVTRVYRMDRAAVIQILEKLAASRDIVLERSEIVGRALHHYRLGKAEFPDYLIASSARAAGCLRTWTFDRKAARDAGMELLGS